MTVHTPEAVTNAIVVLGYQLADNGDIAPPLAKRLDLAIELYRRGVAKAIIVCGWRPLKREDLGIYCEAERMRGYIHSSRNGENITVLVEPHSTSIPENLLFARVLFPSLCQLTVVAGVHALARTRFLGSMIFTGNAKAEYIGCEDGLDNPEREAIILGDTECAFRRFQAREGFRPGKWKMLLLPPKNGRLQSRWNELRLEHFACPYRGKMHPKP